MNILGTLEKKSRKNNLQEKVYKKISKNGREKVFFPLTYYFLSTFDSSTHAWFFLKSLTKKLKHNSGWIIDLKRLDESKYRFRIPGLK